MFDSSSLPVRVGVVVPFSRPTDGGGHEFKTTIFGEICNNIGFNKPIMPYNISFVPVCTSSRSIKEWDLNPSEAIVSDLSSPKRYLSELSFRFRRLRHPFAPKYSHPIVPNQYIFKSLYKKIHVIWSLGYTILTDQIPFISTVWDLAYRVFPFFPEVSRLGEWETRHLYNSVIARKAFLNIVGTRAGSSELSQYLGIDQSRILINPFPCPSPLSVSPYQRTLCLKRYTLTPNRYLLYPAQFWSHKNHLTLLLAFRKLLDYGHDLKLVLTGSDKGAWSSIKKLIVDLGLTPTVVNAGFVSRTELAALYTDSLALVYPSLFGPDNIPPLEAMSYGVPSIVADSVGAREQYGNAVLRFEPTNPDDLLSCVNSLLADPKLRSRLVQEGFSLVSRLTPSGYVNRLLECIHAQRLPLISASL